MCKCCKVPTVDVNSITVSATTVTLNTLPFEGALHCSGRFNLRIPFNFSNIDSGKAVQVADVTDVYPMETLNGNNLRIWQIIAKKKCGTKYLHCRLLNDPAHIQVCDCVLEGINSTVDPILGASLDSASLATTAETAAVTTKAGK